MIHLYEMSRTGKSTEAENSLVVARDLWRRKQGVFAHGYGVFLWNCENIMKLDSGDDCTTL